MSFIVSEGYKNANLVVGDRKAMELRPSMTAGAAFTTCSLFMKISVDKFGTFKTVSSCVDAYYVKVEISHNKWNSLRVIARGQLFEVFLNNKKLFEVENVTFKEPGKVGLWTKADAVTQFDDLKIVSLDE